MDENSLSRTLRDETARSEMNFRGALESAAPRVRISTLASYLRALPVRRGGWWYYPRLQSGRVLYCRAPAVGWEPPVPSVLEAAGIEEVLHPNLTNSVTTGSDSRTGRMFFVDHVGRGHMELTVTGDRCATENAPLRISGVGNTAVWAPTSDWLLHTKLDPALRPAELWAQSVGGSSDAYQLMNELDPEFGIVVYRSNDRIISLSSSATIGETAEWSLRGGQWERSILIPREAGLLHRMFHLRTENGEPLYLVRHATGVGDQDLSLAPASTLGGGFDPLKWQRVFESTRLRTLSDVYVAGRSIILGLRDDALPAVGIVDGYALGPPVMIRPKFTEDLASVRVLDVTPESPYLRVAFMYYTRPPEVCDYEYGSGVLHHRSDPAETGLGISLRATRSWVMVGDVRVPVTILRSKEIQPDGTNPGILIAYGAYQASLDPEPPEELLPLLQRGVVVVFAHVRGGGELGGWWHLAGQGRRKGRSVEDFEACARYAFESGWVAPGKLGGFAASAGALLLAASLNRSPEMFRACLFRQPFVDPYDALLDASRPLTRTDWVEFGNPRDDEKDAEHILTYSPYQNIRQHEYPVMAVILGDMDSRVSNEHVVRWVERIRETSTAGRNIYLWTVEGAGHGARHPAFELAFWERELLEGGLT